MKPLITVIIPVYNVGGYLDICMESIVCQTFTDMEILLINDGSTDDSAQRCRKWQIRDPRVRFIDKENEGVARTRNLGIEMAEGTYIAFVDPDDWVEKTYLEKLYNAICRENARFSECDIWRYDNRSGKKIYRACYGRMGREYTLKEHMKYGPTATYKSLSEKSLWTENDVRMPDCAFESPAVYSLILALAGKVASVHEPLYYYRRFRENSLIENGYAAKDGTVNNTLGIEAMEYLIGEFERTGLKDTYSDILQGIVAYRLNDIMAMQFHRKKNDDFREMTKNFRAFFRRTFPDAEHEEYITFGGYNLNRILSHMDMLHDPSCRFNFSSIISVNSPPVKNCIIEHRNRYRKMMVIREAQRYFWDILEEKKPGRIFLDLMEERFDLVQSGDSIMTRSDAFEESTLAGFAPERTIERDSEECLKLFKTSFDEWYARIRTVVPDIRLTVIESYLSEQTGDLEHREFFPQRDEIIRMNGILAEYYGYVRSVCKEADFVSPAGDELYFTDSHYEYGAVPSHLNEIENELIARNIELRRKNDKGFSNNTGL